MFLYIELCEVMKYIKLMPMLGNKNTFSPGTICIIVEKNYLLITNNVITSIKHEIKSAENYNDEWNCEQLWNVILQDFEARNPKLPNY